MILFPDIRQRLEEYRAEIRGNPFPTLDETHYDFAICDVLIQDLGFTWNTLQEEDSSDLPDPERDLQRQATSSHDGDLGT